MADTWKNGIQNMPCSAILASVPDQSTIFITPLMRKIWLIRMRAASAP